MASMTVCQTSGCPSKMAGRAVARRSGVATSSGVRGGLCTEFGRVACRREGSRSEWKRSYLNYSRRRGDISCSASAEEEIGETASRRTLLLKYVNEVQPHLIDQFMKRAPSTVVEAMRETVTNMIGTLPHQFFEVTVTTVAENLAQLMFSVMMTGYMFRNAQTRLELRETLVSLPSNGGRAVSTLADRDYAPGSQKSDIAGKVLRWNLVDENVESVEAAEYIAMLEEEVKKLQQEVVSLKHTDGNELLAYLKNLEPQNLQELTSMATDDVLEAMNSFIQRLIETNGEVELKASVSETTATELGKLLYWLMVVGYSLRSLEVRLDIERTLGPHPDTAGELPPAAES